MNSPLRIYIICVLIFTVCIYLSPLNSDANWGFAIFLIPFLTLVPAIIIEVFLTFFRKKIPTWMFYLLSVAGVLVSSVGTFMFIFWVTDINTEIHLPQGYNKDYILVVYDVLNQPMIKASIELQRTRRLDIPLDGFLLTSTNREDSGLNMMSTQKIFDSGGILLEKKAHPQTLNKKIFPAGNESFQGQKYYIISIGHNFYDKHQGDSILQTKNFEFLDK